MKVVHPDLYLTILRRTVKNKGQKVKNWILIS